MTRIRLTDADKAWSQQVIARYHGRCQWLLPGCLGEATDACHVIPRRFGQLRLDVDNGIAGCRVCHQKVDANPKLLKALASKILSREAIASLQSKMLHVYGRRFDI